MIKRNLATSFLGCCVSTVKVVRHQLYIEGIAQRQLFGLLMTVFLMVSHFSSGCEAKGVTKKTFRWVTKDSALDYLVNGMSNMETFKKDILDPFNTVRVSGTPENKRVQEHIKSLLSAWGWDIELDTFMDNTPYGEKEFTNIVATFDKSKPHRIALACHFDSKYYQRGRFVAATDSAVPCAVMLETARQLDCLLRKGPKDRSSGKDLTLQLIFFDGEEAFKTWTATDSIYGARHLAGKWSSQTDVGDDGGATKLAKIRELILLDLIGTSDTQFMSQFRQTDDLYDQLSKAEKYLRKFGYLTGKHPGPIFTSGIGYGSIQDDHLPFLNRGVDVLHLISTPFPSVWHKMTDDWAHLDFNLIDDFSRIFRVFISNLLHLQPEERACRKKRHILGNLDEEL